MSTNPALIARERVMPDWLKFGFLAASVLFVCWGGAIAYWRTTRGNPASAELLVFLVGLPACVLLIVVGGHKLLTRSAPAPAPIASSTPATAATSSHTPPLAILAASLRLPHGASPDELASAIADNKARPDLDRELVDDDGFPLMTARTTEAADEALQEEIAEWLALNGMADLHFVDEHWRALTLASAVVADLAAEPLYQADAQIRLQLIPLLPTEWDSAHRRAAGMWLRQTVARHGWPEDRVMVTTDEALTLSAAFQQLSHKVASTNTPWIAMIVACASHIGEKTVARWAEKGDLFTSSQPQGQIPGEGAAGLLITYRAGLPETATIALLDGIEEARRNVSADETKRSDRQVLAELSEKALERSGVGAADVGMLVADTGHRSSRAIELMAHVSAALPHLEETDGVVRVGAASGTCDAVSFIAALALGRHYVVDGKAAVLCVSNEDPYRRVVALIRSSELLHKA
jgi:hypothetical protein